MPNPGGTPEDFHRAGKLHEIHSSCRAVAAILNKEREAAGKPTVRHTTVNKWINKYYASKQFLKLYDDEIVIRKLLHIYELMISVSYLEFSQDTGLAEFYQLKRNPNPNYGVADWIRDTRAVAKDIRDLRGLDAPKRVAIEGGIEQEITIPDEVKDILELEGTAREANARMRAVIEARVLSEQKEAS